MSNWTHAMCDGCWERDQDPDRFRQPYRVLFEQEDEHCCFCGAATTSGIYVRRDPAKMPCHGEHAKGE